MAAIAAARPGRADSWPQFRGPNGSGRPNADVPLPRDIGPNKNVIWSTELPGGHSSPVVVADRIFLTAERGKHLVTLAVERSSGEILWEREAQSDRLEEIHHIGSHAQASPAADPMPCSACPTPTAACPAMPAAVGTGSIDVVGTLRPRVAQTIFMPGESTATV